MARIHSFRNYTVKDGDAAYEQIQLTDAVTVKSLTPPKVANEPVNAATIRITASTAQTAGQPCALYRVNGTDPAPAGTGGLPLFNGDILELFQSEVENFRIMGLDANADYVAVEYAQVT